jgi:hypothetical protein
MFEGWLWIGWVVGFGWFESFFFFVIVGAMNKLMGLLFSPFFSHLSNPTPNLYMDLVALSSTRPDWETLARLASKRSKPSDLDTCPTLSHPPVGFVAQPTNRSYLGFEAQTKKPSW